MTMTGGAIVLRALEDEGIELAFGIPGTHNIELYDELFASKKVRPVLVTDEQSASFMADAAWRASGRMACVNIVPGAGLTHAMSGIGEAFMDAVPMLVLGCGIRRDTGKSFQLHDVDQQALAAPVTKATFLPQTGQEAYSMIRDACRIAREGRPGPVFVEIPANLYFFKHEVEFAHTPVASAVRADDDALNRAAAILENAKRPLLYVGAGAIGAGADLVALAEMLESPVASTFQGKGVFPETHPLFLWPGYGASAPAFARDVVSKCDATLAIGVSFGEVGTGSYGAPPPPPLIHVDIDPTTPGRNYATELAIHGDGADVVRRLVSRVSKRAEDGAMRDTIRRGRQDALAEVRKPSDGLVSPGLLLEALQKRFGSDAIYTTDSGNGTFLAVEGLVVDEPQHLLAPVDYSCMGYSVPAAIGAKLAKPDAPVIALAGDGAFLMTGLEMLTAASLGVPVVFMVLRDRELAQIAQFQSTAFGRKANSELPDYDFASIARGVGVECLSLRNDGEIDDVLQSASKIMAEGRPVAVDVAIDYSRKTFFTKGVVKTNLLRLPWKDRLRFVGRAVARKVF